MIILFYIAIILLAIAFFTYLMTWMMWIIDDGSGRHITMKFSHLKTFYYTLKGHPAYKVFFDDARLYVLEIIPGLYPGNTVAAIRCRWFELFPYIFWRLRMMYGKEKARRADTIEYLIQILDGEISHHQKEAKSNIEKAEELMSQIDTQLKSKIELKL